MTTLQSCDAAAATRDAQALEAVLALVQQRVGTDFRAYRRAAVQRRVRNRMLSAGSPSLSEYLRLLERSPEETGRLIERLTIKVSRFYRNAPTFDFLGRTLIPALSRERRGAPLRIWSAGCGNGEEAYTLGMLLEQAGVAGAVEATDVDQAALERARSGVYPAHALTELPDPLLARYLEGRPGGAAPSWRVREAVRARVRLARHDLTGVVPPAGGRFDLICCRNVLIYFERPAQRRTLQLLQAHAAADGFLCFGEAEWPSAWGGALTAVEPKARVFRAQASEGTSR